MFEGWGEFYLMAGSAAAVLIGLLFVVLTLMHDRPRSTVLMGSKLYMGPIVLQMSFVLALSGAALAVGVTPRIMGLIAAATAAWGLWRGLQSTFGIRALHGAEGADLSDVWLYGVVPSLLYLVLGAVALGFLGAREWATDALAGVLVAMLLSCIRNEWDLVTWLAPAPDEKG
jgi:hypothetical protein